jgi:hypothetical protein
MRAMADANINSQKVVTVNLGRNMDKLSAKYLNPLDALILYDYDYFDKGKVWRLVQDFLVSGKKVFIDTGVENKESASNSLPDVFPIKNTMRTGLGSEWNLTDMGNVLFSGVEVEKLSKPVFDGQPWSFSYPNDDRANEGGQIMLRQSGRVVMVNKKVGKGEVLWSGMNLPYLVSRNHNDAEVVVWKNLVQSLIANKEKILVNSKTTFVNSQKRIIEFSGIGGVLFKEQMYPGWVAWSDGMLQIYKAGPAYPGFMYIPVEKDGTHKVTLLYLGSWVNWFVMGVSALVLMVIGDVFLLDGKVGFGVYKKLGHGFSGWLHKDVE